MNKGNSYTYHKLLKTTGKKPHARVINESHANIKEWTRE